MDVNEPVYVDITNVARWFYAVNSQEIYEWQEDFPRSVLPWPASVWEYTHPGIINKEGKIIEANRAQYKITAVQLQTKPEKTHELVFDGGALDILAGLNGIKRPPWWIQHKPDRETSIVAKEILDNGRECHWIQFFRVWFSVPRGREFDLGVVINFVDGDGVTIGSPSSMPLDDAMLIAEAKGTDAAFEATLFCLFFAMSLLHAKNIELTDKPVSRQYRRLQERKGEPVIQYKTLVIEPFKKQVRNEARASGENEIERALHICRGHFATYTEEAPLFGKITGTFWKPMHVRGTAKAGTVVKDYKVVADDAP